MKIYLMDLNRHMVDSWNKYFKDVPDVTVTMGDMIASPAEVIVSPANSFGFMDGGIDLAISSRVGWDVQVTVQNEIYTRYGGEIPVGCAFSVPLRQGAANAKRLIVAPTMRVPQDVSNTANAYLAARAVFRLLKEEPAESVAMSGFCTLTGRMHPDYAAKQMRLAYEDHWLGKYQHPTDVRQAYWKHQNLTSIFNDQ